MGAYGRGTGMLIFFVGVEVPEGGKMHLFVSSAVEGCWRESKGCLRREDLSFNPAGLQGGSWGKWVRAVSGLRGHARAAPRPTRLKFHFT